MAVRRSPLFAFLTLLALLPIAATAQFAEQNVNMVAGTGWPGGDPYLRQQNEGSVAVSTRNPLHLLAGANDYRSVDINFNAAARPDGEDTGDAWLGVFKSKNGGNTWYSFLHDGYPQQGNLASPLNGFQAAADPVVRAGNNGMFYYAGIVLNRGTGPLSGVFVSRFIDNNNSEVSDPIAYIDTNMIEKGTPGQFIDKPWFAVAPMSNGGMCTVSGQKFAAQNLYLAYTIFLGEENNVHSKLMFALSTDCGATWNTQKLSETFHKNQGATIAVDPSSGNLYVAWRRFQSGNEPNSIVFVKSTDHGRSFTRGMVIPTNINPFEQRTTTVSIRSNAYPTMAVDGSGRIYIAWSQRDPVTGDGRVLLINSMDGVNWSSPMQVDTSPARGHQFMPTMTFGGGKLTLAWYDLREDHTIETYTPSLTNPGTYDLTREFVGNLPGSPGTVFTNFLMEVAPQGYPKLVRRHTLDVFAADSSGGVMPTFLLTQVTRYKVGSRPGTKKIEQLQINPPNLPMFRQGTVPFIGDYIDLAAYVNSPALGSTPTSSVPSRVRHVVWTDDRDVRPPLGNPPDWTKYTPVHSPALGSTSKFDPTQAPLPCDPAFSSSRNQNIYTTRVTDGMFAGSPGNAKPLGKIQRAFAVFVQNARGTGASYRLSFAQQPVGGTASFLQFSLLTQLDVTIPPHSTATRTVFVTGTAHTGVEVNVTEITMAGGGEVAGGLSSVIALNPDITNPDITNPDITNPDITNAEVFNPDITNPDITNPDITNPDITNPDITNPDITNPDITNPDITNPDITNPDITNPDITNPDITNPDITNSDLNNGSASDTTWSATNQGNTTGGFTVKLLKNANLPNGLKTQLTLNKIYDTPVARDCNLGVEHHRQVITNINNPTFATIAELSDPDLTDSTDKSATMWLAPGEIGRITFRVVDPFHKGSTFDASQFITPVVIAQSVNTLDAQGDNTTPSITLTIITTSLPDGAVGQPYRTTLQAIGGVGARTWVALKGLPAGLSLNSSTGVISGTPQNGADSFVTIRVTDSAPKPHTAQRQFTLHISSSPLTITAITPSTAAAGFGQMIVLDVMQVPTLAGLHAFFTDGTITDEGFIFSSPSTSRLFVRLPFPGDGRTTVGLGTGPISVYLQNDSTTGPSASMTLSTTPGTPTIRSVLPTEQTTNESCGGYDVGSSTPTATIMSGMPIGVSAFGVDTTHAVLRYTQNNQFVDAPAFCTNSSDQIGVTPMFQVPQWGDGDITIQIRTSVNEVNSAWSDPVHLTVVSPLSLACTGDLIELFNNWNTGAVQNNGFAPTFSTGVQTYCLDHISNYHWNNALGATPGTIGLTRIGGTALGPWAAVGSSGQGGAPNVNWTATPIGDFPTILRGAYRVDDSDPATWSQNSDSLGLGFSQVWVRKAVPK